MVQNHHRHIVYIVSTRRIFKSVKIEKRPCLTSLSHRQRVIRPRMTMRRLQLKSLQWMYRQQHLLMRQLMRRHCRMCHLTSPRIKISKLAVVAVVLVALVMHVLKKCRRDHRQRQREVQRVCSTYDVKFDGIANKVPTNGSNVHHTTTGCFKQKSFAKRQFVLSLVH